MRFDGSAAQLDMLREIADNLNDPVFLADKAFNVWYHNRAFEEAVGVRMTSRRYQGLPCHALLGLEICQNSCVMKQAVESGENIRLAEILGKTISGEERNFHINAVPVINASGAAFGALIFMRDITSEAQIHQKYKKLVARNSAISLSGVLDRGAFIDILQLLSFLQKTGTLVLESGALRGDIIFERGQMINVSQGGTAGEKALGRMLGWEQGGFSFQPQPVEANARRDNVTEFMLMDAIRRQDELAARQADIPGPQVVPVVARAADPATDAVDKVGLQVCEMAARGDSIAKMIEQITASDAQIYQALLALRDRGVLTW